MLFEDSVAEEDRTVPNLVQVSSSILSAYTQFLFLLESIWNFKNSFLDIETQRVGELEKH